MSDIFENDIDVENENLENLEDSDFSGNNESYNFEHPLIQLKLDYSSESIYAKTENNLNVKPGDFVITPTRYGSDMAKVLGMAKKPLGIKPSDVVTISRKASEADMEKRHELAEKEK